MLDVEAALAEAEASVDVIPPAAATAIRAAARADWYDAAAIESEARQAGNLAIPLVRHLTAGTPLHVLMPQAGLTTTAHLQDLLPFLPTVDPAGEAAASRMRDLTL